MQYSLQPNQICKGDFVQGARDERSTTRKGDANNGSWPRLCRMPQREAISHHEVLLFSFVVCPTASEGAASFCALKINSGIHESFGHLDDP